MRRSFLQTVGAAGVAGATSESGATRTRYYTLESLLLQNGDQVARLHDFLSHGRPRRGGSTPGPSCFWRLWWRSICHNLP